MFCSNCGNQIDDDALFCTKCGAKLSEKHNESFCEKCSSKLDDDALFCTKCGNKVQKNDKKDLSDKIESVSERTIEVTPVEPISVEREKEEVQKTENITISSDVVENQENQKSKKSELIVLLSIVVLIIVAIFIPSREKQNLSPWVSNNTFNFDVLKPYTFNYFDYEIDDDYEFDCYKLDDNQIAKLWNNPPKYAVYNNKTYELDNENLDYFELDTEGIFWSEEFGTAGKTLKNYNVIILWDEYDGKYHHFDGIIVIKGTDAFMLYKYIDFSNYNF